MTPSETLVVGTLDRTGEGACGVVCGDRDSTRHSDSLGSTQDPHSSDSDTADLSDQTAATGFSTDPGCSSPVHAGCTAEPSTLSDVFELLVGGIGLLAGLAGAVAIATALGQGQQSMPGPSASQHPKRSQQTQPDKARKRAKRKPVATIRAWSPAEEQELVYIVEHAEYRQHSLGTTGLRWAAVAKHLGYAASAADAVKAKYQELCTSRQTDCQPACTTTPNSAAPASTPAADVDVDPARAKVEPTPLVSQPATAPESGQALSQPSTTSDAGPTETPNALVLKSGKDLAAYALQQLPNQEGTFKQVINLITCLELTPGVVLKPDMSLDAKGHVRWHNNVQSAMSKLPVFVKTDKKVQGLTVYRLQT